MNIKLEDNIIYITPNILKTKILEYLMTIDKIYDITFITLEEFKEKYFFKIKDEALLYLLDKTKENIDVLDLMMSNLYQIDLTKKYNNKKLIRLQLLLKDLKEHDFLIYDNTFKDYLKSKKLYILGYPLLEDYERVMLDEFTTKEIKIESKYTPQVVYKYNSLKDEVISVATRIRKLNQDGVSYNNIFLAGIDNNYTYILKNVFRMFDIPLYCPLNSSINSLIKVKDYFNNKDINSITDPDLKRKLISIEDSLIYAKDSIYYDLLLKKKLENTSIDFSEEIECVKVLNEALDIPYLISSDDYLFVLGFNQNFIPKIYKDEDFLSDNLKKECLMLTSFEKNKLVKENLKKVLGTVRNLNLSYKLVSLTSEYAKSSFLNEIVNEEKETSFINYNYSSKYNNYKLAVILDDYNKFHIKHKDFDFLTKNIDSSYYNSYNHKYTPINKSRSDFNLSYSSFNDYALCPFRYYLKHILKLDEYAKSFSQKIGNIYHYVLFDSYSDNFDFETSFKRALAEEVLDKRELFLLKRLKEELIFIIKVNKEEEKSTALTSFYGEKKIELKIAPNVTLKGFIDKILYYSKNNKDYYAVFDYKTGNVELNLDYLDEGLYLQLPLYVYLIEKSNLFNNPTFAGLFYQTLLKPSNNLIDKRTNLRLLGYVAKEEETLEYLDENYKDSTFIKGLSYTKNDTLSTRCKALNKEEVSLMVKKIDTLLKDTTININNNNFVIAPKIIDNKNISCNYCPFQEVCFHDVTDNIYLKRKEEEDA